MTKDTPASEFLVISRGHWDEHLSSDELQRVIDSFYEWHAGLVAEGRMKPGQRLAPPVKRVSRDGVVDGPYAEAKELIGGYWFILAENLDAAATLAAGNPCLACGLVNEIRPIEPALARADAPATETPASWRKR